MRGLVGLLFAILFLLQACGGDTHLRQRLNNWDPHQYTVQKGDTLYSIAWRYDLDFRSLADWNSIRVPYTIFPGQRIKMQAPVEAPKNKTYLFGGHEKPAKDRQAAQKTHSKIVVPVNRDYSKPSNIPAPPPLHSKSNKVPLVKKKITPENRKKTTVTKKQTKSTPAIKTYRSNNKKIQWSWPVKGKLFSTFAANNTSRKGIDIIGVKGEKVKAASEGIVVYSGAGLLSYGNLIIIKHNDRYLSAYAHNKRLLVKEGQRVNRQQVIAVIGKKSNVTNLLHFEIRKDGKPVNPLVYLP